MRARLILENGTIFEGRAFGHFRETVGEIVFNTSMAGYQEIITDPSNYGKIVMMTYPLVGNYGINLDDMESSGPKLKALVVREKADWASNWRNEITLEDFLKQNRILGLEGIDTRALTRIIRSQASMKAIITFRELSKGQIKQHFQSFNNNMAVAQISTGEKYIIDGRGKKVGVIDLGITKSTLELLKDKDFKLTIYPYNVGVEEISNDNLDGIFLPNGPGDPGDLLGLIDNLKEILGKFPILGSGLGNEVLAISLGAKISSMKYGHRGINQPVKDLENNRIIISAQNHGYLVEEEGLPGDIEITHRNINDGSVEGIENKYLKAFGVEFYPDNIVLDKFINNMEGQNA